MRVGQVLSASRVLRQGDLRSVMIAARGTSDNAALYAKYLFEVLLGVPGPCLAVHLYSVREQDESRRSAGCGHQPVWRKPGRSGDYPQIG